MAGTSDRIHPGLGEGTVVWTHHHRCVCGELFPMQVIVAVDAVADPGLAARAARAQEGKELNQCTCPVCGTDCFAETPYSYHDGRQELVVLVLPTSYRHRELEERAALLLGLSTQDAPSPAYAVDFGVVYGPAQLLQVLESAASDAEGASDSQGRRSTVSGTELEEAALREQGLDERLSDLQRLTADLDARSSELTARELALRDRKSALDRRTEELEEKTSVLAQARASFRAESEGDMPAILRDDETQALSTDDILTSAPDPNTDGPMKIPTSASVSGSSVGKAPRSPVDDLMDEETPAPILLERKAKVPPGRADSEVVTEEQMQLSDVNALKDTEPNLGKSGAPNGAALLDGVAEPNDPEIVAWCKRKGEALKLLRGHDVWLTASVPNENRKELSATDIRALLQLHRMPSYPLVTLTLANARTLAGEPGKPFSFHFDVGDTADREMLEQLAKSFRFKLEVFNEAYMPVQQRRLAAPLSANVHFVVALALDTLREIAPPKRSFSRAIKDFAKEDYDRLGRSHPLATEFKDSQLDKLEKANEVLAALELCERFSASAGEEYLVAIRSYPFERWHQRRLSVILRAIELGLWMGPSLAQVATSEGLVRSARELVVRCQNHFATFVSQGGQGLASKAIERNWAVLEQQATALGLGGNATDGADPISQTGTHAAYSDGDLEDRLQDSKLRIDAIAELSRRQVTSAVAPISRVLAQLNASEAPVAFASFVKLGSAATPSLLVFLECPTPHLRHAAALALCEFRQEAGVDSVSESLMTEDGNLWREYALALGQVGASAIMPVVARVAGKGKREQARAVWALGYIAGQGGRKSVETLSRGKDASVASVALSALELEGRLRSGTISTERDPEQSRLSEAFYACLSGIVAPASTAEISGQAMLLDEADLLEASDP